MKKILLSFVSFLLCAGAYGQAIPITVTLGSPSAFMPGQTNTTSAIDVTGGQSLSLAAKWTGVATTTATISVTNPAGTTNGCIISFLGASNSLFLFTNSPIYTNAIPTNNATLVTVGVTNNTVTNGHTISIILGAFTNTYTLTNESIAYTQIATNTNAASTATNIYTRLVTDYPSMAFTVADSLVTIQVATNANLSVTSSSFATNGSTTLFTSTNYVATNSLQILTNATPAGTTTNLYEKLVSEFGTGYNISYGSSTSIVVKTYTSTGLSVTNAGNWASITLATNAALGTITFSASNSLDSVKWFRDSARDFTATIASGGVLTNFNSLGAVGYQSYSIASPTTNGAASEFTLEYSVK